MFKREALSLQCAYCHKEFGLLVLSDPIERSKEVRIDIRRILQDYRVFSVCSDCAYNKGKVFDEHDEDMRYTRVRRNE